MKNHFYRLSLLLLFLLGYGFNSHASHLRGGEIKVDRTSGPGLRYKITVINYVDPTSSVGGGQLNLGDGLVIDLSNSDFLISQEPLNEKTTISIYEVFHTFAGPGLYTISYIDFNRNGGILNIPNSIAEPFYVESLVVIDPFLGDNTQPEFSFPLIDVAIAGKAFFHNMGAYDPDGDSLAYQLVTPKQSMEKNVDGYSFPNDIMHYEGLNYSVANEDMTGPPTLAIDATTGDLSWDAPGLTGEYGLAIRVEEWRKFEGKWIKIGHRVRDMQITVEESNNQGPDFTAPDDTCVVANSLLETSLLTSDPDGHEVFFTTQSEVYNLAGNSATFTTESGPIDGTGFLDFRWTPSCDNARNRPYSIYFKSQDNPPSEEGPGLATFETWNITVAGAPEGLHGKVRNVGEVTLNWSDYFCSVAKSIAIYRIENSFTFAQDNCQPGVPDGSGFELIAEVNPDDNSFTDDNGGSGLDPNTNYCYRLVAIFEDNIGGESVASAEFCARPNEESLVTGVGDKGPVSDFEDNIVIYPNPAHKSINFDFHLPAFEPLMVGISDLQGKVFRQQELPLHNNHHQMSLEGTAPGMYLIWVKTGTQVVTRKIVVN